MKEVLKRSSTKLEAKIHMVPPHLRRNSIHIMNETPTIFGRESDTRLENGPDFMPKVKVIRQYECGETEIELQGFPVW